MNNENKDWKIVAELIFQFNVNLDESNESADNLWSHINDAETEVKTSDGHLYLEYEDHFTSGDFESEEGDSYIFSDVQVNLAGIYRNMTLSEAKEIVLEEIQKAHFVFTKSEIVNIEFHRINNWQFFDLNKSEDEPEYSYDGVEIEFEMEIFGEKKAINGYWDLDNSGKLVWKK